MAHNQMYPLKNQVAGHAGFFSPQGESNICLKPFNIKCVRGRREHLFYQLIEHFKRNPAGDLPDVNSEPKNLYYKHFNLLTLPSPATKCNCIIDEALFKLLSSFVANFYHVRHFSELDGNFITLPLRKEQLLSLDQSEKLMCPCYGRDPKEKSLCSREYEKINFLCLEDLTAHCREPCIVDIKIGQITYDPMAIKEKVLEQSTKYRRLREFGFRILGMKLGEQIKDKTYGKALETTKQVYDALDSFFTPLTISQYKSAIIERILERLKDLLELFETKNINQLKFFSSSLLIVYDSYISDKSRPINVTKVELANTVRVSMIDFAHVFHIHSPSQPKDDSTGSPGSKDLNYMFGLKKLEQFFIKLNQHHQSPLHQDSHPPQG